MRFTDRSSAERAMLRFHREYGNPEYTYRIETRWNGFEVSVWSGVNFVTYV